jgi:hypothetical protein
MNGGVFSAALEDMTHHFQKTMIRRPEGAAAMA